MFRGRSDLVGHRFMGWGQVLSIRNDQAVVQAAG
jgi:hypothetical protein